tara:strand:- start:286 stop:1365 length:1080 start_codon:yes stop_codon:yes gene_type:complete
MRDGSVQRVSMSSGSIKTMNDVEDQRDNLSNNKKRGKSVKLLIDAFNNKYLSHEIRMASLEALAESKDKLVLEAIQKSVRNAELLDLEIMIKSVELLSKHGDSETISALVSGLKKSESKILNLRKIIVEAIGENGSDDHIITLLDLYEISRINHQKNSELLSITLGDMGDDRAIPILIEIAKNKNNDLRTRKIAVDILAKKESDELVDYFIELLGDADSRQSMNEFAVEVMGDLNNERMILALLESYQIGKQQYYSMLIKLMDVMSDSENIYLKSVITEICLTEHLPYHIRIKALKSLSNFGDPSVIDEIIPILENPKNYVFYDAIVEMILSLDAMPDYKDKLRKAGLRAAESNQDLIK